MHDLVTDNAIIEDRQGEVFGRQEDIMTSTIPSKRFYIESYGCQMNFSDSEIVASILGQEGFIATKDLNEADLILLNTCSIREKAEDTVRKRLHSFDRLKVNKPGALIGMLGCMAERMKKSLLEEEKLVDIVVGPDAYRSLPALIAEAEDGNKGINVFLSREETYADISPVRLDSNGITAFISIMRGCDNMCSFCVVPYTRGRERSRDLLSIVAEATSLYEKGFKEITLLGQNVDSYKWTNPENGEKINFALLLEQVALVNPELRVRFSTSHPKDITDDVLFTMAKYENICKYIHLPLQSGSSKVLDLMNRTYDRPWYEAKVASIRRILPECAISSDIITGFCDESEDDHLETLEVIKSSQYSMSYMFAYSERPGTPAAKKLVDNIDDETKKRRLNEVIALQNRISLENNRHDIGKVCKVLIEGDSKKSPDEFKGRNSQNKMIVFPKKENLKPGQYVYVKVHDANSATLFGNII